MGEWVADVCPKVDPPTTGSQWDKIFYRQSGGILHVETTASPDSHLQTGLRCSDQHHLGCLGTVNIQFQGPFVLISLQPVLGCVAAHVLGTVWSSCS